MQHRYRTLFVILLVLVSLNTLHAQSQKTLVVFAAASLTDAFEAIGTEFEAAYPDTTVVFNFAGSATLAAQLAQGAPADVFASANPQQMAVAQAAGRISGDPQIFAYNELTVVLPADNPAQIQTLADLANPGIGLILAAPGVPVRDYTNLALMQLSQTSNLPDTFAEQVLSNRVSEEANVRQVVAKVVLGEADAGIVYASDITPDIQDRVLTLTIPPEANIRAEYPIAMTDDTPEPERAAAFISFVLSQQSQSILTQWGLRSVEMQAVIPMCRFTRSEGLIFTFICDAADRTWQRINGG